MKISVLSVLSQNNQILVQSDILAKESNSSLICTSTSSERAQSAFRSLKCQQKPAMFLPTREADNRYLIVKPKPHSFTIEGYISLFNLFGSL